jgi:small-conductance mechanosensitive channel
MLRCGYGRRLRLLELLGVSDWLRWAGDVAASREVLQSLALQLALIAAIFAVAWGIRLATRPLTDRLAERIERYPQVSRVASNLREIVTLAYAWLLLLIGERVAARFGSDLKLVGIAATLAALWIVLHASSLLFRDALLARVVAAVAWIVAALDITGLLGPTTAALDGAALTIGTLRLSLLLVVKAVLVIAILMWAALGLARLASIRIRLLAGLSPSVQTLAANLIKIVLVSLALLIGLNTVGIDLTAFAVFSGAVGVGLGFGLQKIVSNFVSGIILLLERSIKPGDVIEVGHTYGLVTALGARYASVHGRDGKEYLIPNETLITNQVTNWSYSSPLLRLDAAFGVSYDSDLHEVRRLAIEAAQQTGRVLAAPAPVCHVTEFGDNAVHLLLRFWIGDPANGVRNVTGDVYLALWDSLRAHGVELPFPQREIRIRELPAELSRRAASRAAAK